MTTSSVRAAADLLAALRIRSGNDTKPLVTLPDAVRPADVDAAYAVQAAVAERLTTTVLGAPCGWKIGCTTAIMQEYLNIQHPCAGRLYSQRIFADSAQLHAADYFQLGLECELAVWLGDELGAGGKPHSNEAVGQAITSACVSIEIVEHRFADFTAAGTPSLVADDFFSVGCIYAQPMAIASWDTLDALTGGFHVNGIAPEQTGAGSEILGHPLTALSWLADHAAAQGTVLRAGELITLGSVVKTIYPIPGDIIEARFGDAPSARVVVT